MDRQDRQGVRTPADLERKYRFTEAFRKIWDAITGVKKSEEDHVKDRNNPHGVTAKQVGAAPAGFGLNNDLKSARTPAEVDAFKTSGWYRYITSAGETLISGFDILYAGIRVDSYSAGEITVQTIYPTAPHQGYLLRRYFINGAWTAFEWENPPMELGKEYRTTERYNGKAVYVKSVSVGKLTNGTNVKITGVSEAGAVRAMVKAGGYTAPFYSNATLIFGYSLGPTTGGVNVGLYSNGTLDALNVTVTIWYTKD